MKLHPLETQIFLYQDTNKFQKPQINYGSDDDFDGGYLSDEGNTVLNKIPESKIKIGGHVDTQPDEEANIGSISLLSPDLTFFR